MVPTVAERLGFRAADRVAVVHVDDIGMCHAANEGAFEALAKGPATCGSVMVPCPWFAEAAERARADPELDLGVHLTLNSEWPRYRWGPVAARSAVPSLLDDAGMLPRTSLGTARRARPEEVEIELRAQIERALATGIDVTHLDSHMGTCVLAPFLPIYVKLAREFELPVFAARPDRAVLERAGIAAAFEVLRALEDAARAAGLPVLDGCDLGMPSDAGEAHELERVAGLGSGVSWLLCHAAHDGEELRAIAPESAEQRDCERRFWGGAAGRRALEAAGVRTVGMRAIRALLRSERRPEGDPR